MVNTEVLDPEPAEIGWRRFNLPWYTGYSPKRCRKGLYLIIHKDTNYFRPHRLRAILLFDLEANTHNKALGRYTISQSEELERISPEQYGRQKYKASNVQSLNTLLFYDLVIQKKVTSTGVFADPISNYDLVVHSIASLALQIAKAPRNQSIAHLETYITWYTVSERPL